MLSEDKKIIHTALTASVYSPKIMEVIEIIVISCLQKCNKLYKSHLAGQLLNLILHIFKFSALKFILQRYFATNRYHCLLLTLISRTNINKNPTRCDSMQSDPFYCRITLHVSGVHRTHHQEY